MLIDRSLAAKSVGLFNILAAFGFVFLWFLIGRELNYQAFRDRQEPEPSILWNSILIALLGIAAGLFLTGLLSIRQYHFRTVQILSILVAVLAFPFIFIGWIWTFAGIAGFFLGIVTLIINIKGSNKALQ